MDWTGAGSPPSLGEPKQKKRTSKVGRGLSRINQKKKPRILVNGVQKETEFYAIAPRKKGGKRIEV